MSNTPADTLSNQADNAWRVMILLFFVNMLNFFDRTIPAVVLEPIRKEFNLNDLQLGFLSAAFVIVYAIAGVPLGRLSDTKSRKKILAAGLAAWSVLTAATGAAWSFVSLVMIRMGVGVGEASCAPAATSMIGDLFPTQKRARAMGVFMLGLPLGLILAFFTVGAMVKAFGSWRAPFLIAAVPGLLLALFVLIIREPKRGAAETVDIGSEPIDKPLSRILKIKTMWWIIASGITVNFAAYAGNAFMVPLLQRFYGLPLTKAAVLTGLIVGVTGLIGLTLGGQIADKIHQRSETGRLKYGAFMLLIASIGTFFALRQDNTALQIFAVLFGVGWLTYYSYYTTVYPALQDVVEPRLRATAMALYFAGMYLLGGAVGPMVVGALSDSFAKRAMEATSASTLTDAIRGQGLHDAMFLIPVALFLTAIFVVLASLSFHKDHLAMVAEMEKK